ncbi:MAG: ABC transporter substrate-binding protein [Lachnospiraceae bacterium]|nr:ABC transporter substrate-binding protein [Lachnospiraceae bacterium]
MMKKISRRDFLRGSAAALVGAMTFAPCVNASEDAASSTISAMEEQGFVFVQDLMSYDNIDTSRTNTYTSGGRLDQVTIYVAGEVSTWTPWQPNRGRDAMIDVIYEPLFYYSDGFELVPCLAKEWYEEDDTHFVVTIYDYITDFDGNNLTASDVVAAFDYYATSGNANDFDYYESSEAIDDYTVRFTWTGPIDSETALCTMMETALYTQQAFNDHEFVSDPVGTGAYYLDTLTPGSEYILKVNENYWQTDDSVRCEVSKQNVETIDYKVIQDSTMAYISFKAGEVYNYNLESSNIADFKEGGDYYGQYTVVYDNATGRTGLAFNQAGNSIMSDENMRLAVAYAIDSEALTAAIGSDVYYMAHAEAGSGVTGYNSEWDTRDNYYNTYDPELAKEYLAKTDYNGETLIYLSQSGSDATNLTAQVIQQMLAQVGINVELALYEDAIIDTYRYNLDYWDLYLFSWLGDPISQQWGRQFDMNNYTHGANEAGINDEYLQDMIERVQSVSTCTDELIDEIQTYITDNCMCYSLYAQITYTVYNPSIARLNTFRGHSKVAWGANEYYLD